MSKVKILVSGGIGDCLLGFSCSDIVKKQGHDVDIGVCARNEIFNFLKEIFKDKFNNISQLSEVFVEDYQIEKDDKNWAFLTKGYDESYLVIPDLLFRNPHKFNYQKYNFNISQVKNYKLLEDLRKPQDNLCYLALLSVTNGYTYPYISDLVSFLCLQNPKWNFYIAQGVTWNGKKIHIDIKAKYPNLIVDENPTLLNSFDYMKRASFAITTDNGPMHLFNHLGVEKLVLDPQFNRMPFIARWRQSLDDSIPITTSAMDVARLTKNLLNNEIARLLPRKLLLDRLLQGEINYPQELIYKF